MTKIKICGLRREIDIRYANECLPDYIGFVFAESRRQIEPAAAAKLRARLDPRVQAAGVFVNQEISLITGLYRGGVIDMAQLHGDEDEDYITALRAAAVPVVRAVAAGAAIAAPETSADFLLFDAAPAGSGFRGGAGRTFDWRILRDIRPRVSRPFFLAGGLTADNLAAAIQLLRPYGVDLSSGVESGGWKDLVKMRAVVEITRAARD